jgi:neopullulanase
MLSRFALLTLLFMAGVEVHAAVRIERVEPLSWWIGMREPTVQLLVHGEAIAGLEPRIRYPGVTLEGVERVTNPNYLFLNLRIAPETRPGLLQIELRRDGRTVARWPFQLQGRAPGSAMRAGFGPGDTVYLITPDRFANGDPANDTVRGFDDAPDRAKPLGRHGGDLKGVIDHLDYVAGMGFTQLWLNPVLENAQPEASYHGYAITDFYRVDPRFGSNELYRQLSRDARERGLGLIMDVVLNHSGSNHWWLRDPPTADWINNGGQFVATTHAREVLQDPHGAESDRIAFADGWFVPTMPDLNQRNMLLATYLIQNTLWWIEYAELSGLRVDTYPYSDRAFLTAWSKRVTEEYPNLGVVGEEWTSNPISVAYWMRGNQPRDGNVSYLPSLFDFPLQEALKAGLVEPEGWGTGLRRIYRTIASDVVYSDPSQLMVFADNHDMSRIFTALGDRADLARMAHTLVLTTRGTPQLYYGSEILLGNPGTEDHGVIRGDFPGGWPGDTSNAFTGAGLSPDARAMQDYLRALLQWRRTSSAMKDGSLTHFFPVDGLYVYFRRAPSQTVMVVLNVNDAARTVATGRFAEALGSATRATDVITRQEQELAGGLSVQPRSATVFELH